jgi:hypothetical protein
MTFFAENFLDMLVEVVMVQQLLGRADDGTPQYGSPRAYPARINYETHNVVGPQNQLVTANGVVWMACIDPIRADDKIIFPDGSVPTILRVIAGADENGPAYTKLDFQ